MSSSSSPSEPDSESDPVVRYMRGTACSRSFAAHRDRFFFFTTEQLLQDGSSASVSRAPARGSAAGSPVHAPRERSRRRHRREMVLVAEPLGAAPGSIEPGLRACTVVGGAVAAQTGNRRHVLVAAGVRRCVPAVEPGRVVAELGEPRLDARDAVNFFARCCDRGRVSFVAGFAEPCCDGRETRPSEEGAEGCRMRSGRAPGHVEL